MSYAINAPVPWPVPPDWANGVRERLGWLTDVIQAKNGKRQKRELRLAPRRVFDFEVIADEQLRRVLDALLMEHGGKYFMLPIWHDVQLLDTPLAAGQSFVTCRTVGFEFVQEGYALLWLAINQWQLVGIADIEEDGLQLGTLTSREWPLGTRIYPVRRARLVDQPTEAGWTDSSGKRSVSMMIDEPCDWQGVLPATLYRGYPVLEQRTDVGEDLPTTFNRSLDLVDVETGPVSVFDYPQRPFKGSSVRWLAHGREENAALRSLLYGLRGRMGTVWLPSWNSDLQLVAPISAVATTINVQWAGYTVFGRMQAGWRDIRIELYDGTRFFRRINSAAQAGDTEQLGIDAALGVAIAVGQVRAISFMVLSALESDTVELQHETDADGLTIVTASFIGERHDV